MIVFFLLSLTTIRDRYLCLKETLNYNHEEPSLLTFNREFTVHISFSISVSHLQTMHPRQMATRQTWHCFTLDGSFHFSIACVIFQYSHLFYIPHLTLHINSVSSFCCYCCCYHNFAVQKTKDLPKIMQLVSDSLGI